jgi:hypothetical protein
LRTKEEEEMKRKYKWNRIDSVGAADSRDLECELLSRALARTEQSIRDVHVALANLTEKRFNQQAELTRRANGEN